MMPLCVRLTEPPRHTPRRHCPARGSGGQGLGLPRLTPIFRLARRRAAVRNLVVAGLAGGTLLVALGLYIPAKAALAQALLDRAWAASADEHRAVRPWPWADTWPIARLVLPQRSRPLTVLAGASGRNLAFGPALVDGTAALGTNGVSVIAGHRDTHFRALQSLARGDRLSIELPDGSRQTYEVAALEIVDAERAAVPLDADKPVLMLVTCYPFDALVPGGPLRYVVTAYRT